MLAFGTAAKRCRRPERVRPADKHVDRFVTWCVYRDVAEKAFRDEPSSIGQADPGAMSYRTRRAVGEATLRLLLRIGCTRLTTAEVARLARKERTIVCVMQGGSIHRHSLHRNGACR